MLDSSLVFKIPRWVFEELFSGPIPVFVASLVPELFTCLLENSQHEQSIVEVEFG